MQPETIQQHKNFYRMKKYLLAKILFIFFSITTVIIFMLLPSGAFIDIAGSIETAIALFAINTIGLIVSLPFYVW